MRRREFLAFLGSAAMAWPRAVIAQQPERLWRVGVVIQGDSYLVGVDGLREGLKAAGLEEGRQIALLVRDAKGASTAVEAAARALERDDGVDLIVAFATSVALAAKRSTANVPIVFIAGSDPAEVGLVDTLARPGGRLTGVHSITTDLTSKRIEILRELMPTLRRVLTFYNPDNRSAVSSLESARYAERRFGIDLVAQPVSSTQDIDKRLHALSASDADAYVFVSDSMVSDYSGPILDRANALGMPTMVSRLDTMGEGALIGYGFSYRDLGRRAAGYVSRILAGTSPRDLPVEAVSVPALAINQKAAKALGIEIPPSLLDRADEVIE